MITLMRLLLFFALGVLLAHMGFFVTSWPFWGVTGITSLLYALGLHEGKQA